MSKLKFIDQILPSGPIAMGGFGSRGSLLFFRNAKAASRGQGHAVAIIGREWDSAAKECRYLVQDSDGPFRVGGMFLGDKFEPYRWISQAALLEDLSLDVHCYAAHK